jgi:hypothetical protein
MRCKAPVALLLIANASAQVLPKHVTNIFPPDEDPRYFPRGVFAEEAVVKVDGDFTARWYAQQLRALKEPSLSDDAAIGAESVYRFTWLRTADHPIAIRITVHGNGTGTLTAKISSGAGGYEPGRLIANTTRGVSVREVRHMLDLIESMGFWQMPSEPAPGDTVGLDGAQWIREASGRSAYHVIDRWSPQDGLLRELGLYLALKLGKLPVSGKTIY